MSMYGSTHSHFEDKYDATTDMTTALLNYHKAGCKKVAATGHGIFSQFEDLKDIEKMLRKKDPTFDLEVIPGIEGYVDIPELGVEAAHMIIIVKDYEGYVSFCRLVSESANHVDAKGRPIITLDNLRENVKKGHLICTSACIAGIFGTDLGLKERDLEQTIERVKKKIPEDFSELKKNVILYQDAKSVKKAFKYEKTAAEKEFKATGNRQLLDEWEQKNALYEKAQETLKSMPEDIQQQINQYNKILKEADNIEALEAQIEELHDTKEERFKKMEEVYRQLEDIFGRENFYFELQNHGIPVEETIYNGIVDFAIRVRNPHFIASNDVHIGTTKQDREYETELLKRQVLQYERFKTYNPPAPDAPEYCIKSDEELRTELEKIITDHGSMKKEAIIDAAIANIEGALSQCHVYFPEQQYEDTKDESLKPNHYPKLCENENEEFIRLVHEGIKVKFPNGFPSPEYEERMEREIEVITGMGYAGYHLIVQDYLAYGRLLGYLSPEEIETAPLSIEELDKYLTDTGNLRIGHGIGPGRGSAAGSLCCYLLGITDVDPIKYDLLFERFLNVERVSMPDIDSDFKTDIREKVISYCEHKYGKDNVCRIMTKTYGKSAQIAGDDEEENTSMSKGNIRRAGRYLAAEENYMLEQEAGDDEEKIIEIRKGAKEKERIYLAAADRISKRFDELLALKDDTGNSYDAGYIFRMLEKEISSTSNTPEMDVKIIRLAADIDGVFTGYGQHAAGVIISKDPLKDIIPLYYNTTKQNIQTQCQMAQAEAKGLLKMDFLGLTNLDIITNITRFPSNPDDKDAHLQNYADREKIFNDPNIYKDIFSSGMTQGVFQFEKPAMKRFLKNLQPEGFEDIVLLNAANRPGPMAYIPEITAWKWYNKFGGDYAKYSAKIKEIYPFNANHRKKALESGQEYEYAKFYDENGNVLSVPGKTITIDCPALNKILEPTYGCPIYQEQIMRIFQDMAGYSLGGADIVRRYMSKKKMDKLAHEEQAFIYGDPERGIEGCMKKQGITEQQAKELFDQMMPFAKYGFNKSHAVAYSQVALYTAYLKRYHTYDFYRYSLNAVKSLDEIDDFIKEMRKQGIRLLPPRIGKSHNDFTVEVRENDPTKADIRYGYSLIKGVGEQKIAHPTTCLQEFIKFNPDVSMAVIRKFIELGMFTSRWMLPTEQYKKYEEHLVNGSRSTLIMWLDKYGDNFNKLCRTAEAIELLTKAQEKAKEEFGEESKEYQDATKELEKKTTSYNNLRERMIKETQSDPECYTSEAYRTATPHEETEAEIRKNRNVEIEMTRNCYCYNKSYYKLKKLNNHNTFDDVERAGKALSVPCIILHVSDMPYYTVSEYHTPYYRATLMDMKGNTIVRRFDTNLAGMNEGILKIEPESRKYLISKETPQSLGVSFGENSRNQKKEAPFPEYHKNATKKEDVDFFQSATKCKDEPDKDASSEEAGDTPPGLE